MEDKKLQRAINVLNKYDYEMDNSAQSDGRLIDEMKKIFSEPERPKTSEIRSIHEVINEN